MAETRSAKFAVVTGGSSGIGYHLARIFAQNGYDVLITAENDAVQKAAAELGQLGGSIKAVQADLANYEEVEKLWQAIEAEGRPVDAIAINAGIGAGGEFATETSLDQELNIVQLNVASTVHLAKRAVQQMVPRGKGRILFTASIAGTMPTPLEAVYGASKAFVLEFAQSLYYELKNRGISVTALKPGPTDTNFFHRAGMDDTKAGSSGKEQNDPADVAQQGYDALMSGKKEVFAASPGTKAQDALGKVLPDSVKAAAHEKLTRHGSAK